MRGALGVTIVPVGGCRRRLSTALGRGEAVGLVADRVIGRSRRAGGALRGARAPARRARRAVRGRPARRSALAGHRAERSRASGSGTPCRSGAAPGRPAGAAVTRRSSTPRRGRSSASSRALPSSGGRCCSRSGRERRAHEQSGRRDRPATRPMRPASQVARRRPGAHPHARASDGVSGVETILAARGRAPASTSSPSPTTSASTRRVAAQAIAEERRPAARGHRGRGDHHPQRPPRRALFMTRRIRPWQSLMRDASPRSMTRAASPIVAHPLVPYPLVRQRARHPAAARRGRPGATTLTRIEAFNPTTARLRWSRRVPAFAEEVGLAPVASSRRPSRATTVGRA